VPEGGGVLGGGVLGGGALGGGVLGAWIPALLRAAPQSAVVPGVGGGQLCGRHSPLMATRQYPCPRSCRAEGGGGPCPARCCRLRAKRACVVNRKHTFPPSMAHLPDVLVLAFDKQGVHFLDTRRVSRGLGRRWGPIVEAGGGGKLGGGGDRHG
jgi:hypothetical protein